MRIFIFTSEASPDLRAFSGDLGGEDLPDQFQPWRAIGSVAPDRDPPHNLSGDTIEQRSRTTVFSFGVSAKSAQARNHDPGDLAPDAQGDFRND